jgi:hypothetical protein
VNHRATPRFWECYNALPKEVRTLADRCYAQLKADPKHPSLHFKQVGRLWSARVGLHHRALAVEDGEQRAWFWIGTHADYDRLLGRPPANKRLQPTAAARPPKKRTKPPRLKRSR